MATEDTVTGTAVDHRWELHQDDYETYSFIFDQSVAMTRSESLLDKATGALLFSIINAWEKNGRTVPIQVISSAFTVAEEFEVYDAIPDDIVHLDFDPGTP